MNIGVRRSAALFLMLCTATDSYAEVPVAKYRAISVRDFVVDGPQLAHQNARVALTGAYSMQGTVDVLYENQMGVIAANHYNPDVPVVHLLLDGASHEVRAAMLQCRSGYTLRQTGCMMTVRGTVTECTMTSAFGGSMNTLCLNVESGGVYAPPPPNQQSPQVSATAPSGDKQPPDHGLVACIRSPEMAGVSDVYRKCLAKLGQPIPPGP